jgi:hypothetical protein
MGSDVDAYVCEAGVEERLHLLPHESRQRLTADAGKVR